MKDGKAIGIAAMVCLVAYALSKNRETVAAKVGGGSGKVVDTIYMDNSKMLLLPPNVFIAGLVADYGQATFDDYVEKAGAQLAKLYSEQFPAIFGTNVTPERAAASALSAWGESGANAEQALAAELYFAEHNGSVPSDVEYYDVLAMKPVYKTVTPGVTPLPPEQPYVPPAPPPDDWEIPAYGPGGEQYW